MYLLTEVYGEEYLEEILEQGKEKFESNKKYQNLLKQEQDRKLVQEKVEINEVPF
ncbi:hypothetical protein LEP1GSC067_3624 [Leptospira interrogans serovar Lora str. TE 1992]|uniref:Uncharacterized protein n=3 Tax=Leptospiraceae TaxID=170 RepID=M6HDB1_LEPIR|nr:hypothetical protein LEP1GSC067_3624 [Leptospira interrogans serovar Lora str. TE 1992]EMM95060.1 hypothetical protein LEP1GSC158_1625 [Leptospira interrogans serovar Zanoni str. LT2156]